MAYNVQKRGSKFQLRVKHKMLPKPFFHTFTDETEAKNYGDQLCRLLAKGIVPVEMMADKPKAEHDPLVTQIMTDYEASVPITSSGSELFRPMKMEVAGVRFSGVTFVWAESYVKMLKSPEYHLAPGTIRKRVEALARALDWYIKSITVEGTQPRINPLRMLSRGYSVYGQDEPEPKFDKSRDRRLAPEEALRVLAALDGVKREDKERPLTKDAQFELLFMIIVDTGLRLFEAYRLRTDSFDFAKHIIKVDGSKGPRGLIKPRVVPIKKHLRPLLQAWCKDRVGLIFDYWDGTTDGRKATQNRLSKRFSGLFDYAKVPDFTEHDLRHEAACRWFELRRPDGAWVFSEIEICKIMGWSSTKMALRYASLRGEDLSSRLG